MICDACKNAGILSGKIKDISELKVGYQYVMDTGHFTGTFFDWVADVQRRIDMFHMQCAGHMHCDCQHKVERLTRDLT